MTPNNQFIQEFLLLLDIFKYLIINMSSLALCAIPSEESIRYINDQKINSIVFGASSEKNTRETKQLIDQYMLY